MLTAEENDLLCRVEGDAPMGQLMRRHWIPACLSEEVSEPDGAPVRTRLLGASDRGIVLYRKLLKEQILAVQRGEEPVGVVRDPEKNKSIHIALSESQGRFARRMMKAG